jgi:apolipoprotein N-acyltransferase
LLGGFTFGLLGHTQWRWTTLIQLADTLGAIGIGGVVMAGAAALATLLPDSLLSNSVSSSVPASGDRPTRREQVASLAAAALLVAGTLAYGAWRLAAAPPPVAKPLEVLLVQGSIDTELKHDPDAAGDVLLEYDTLTVEGLAADAGTQRPDLIVWPETMWRWGLIEIDPAEPLDEAVVAHALGTDAVPADPAVRQAQARAALEAERLEMLGRYARRYGTHWLVGLDKQRITPRAAGGAEHFNCALFLDDSGAALGCYEKMHPVMFGEYVPLADRFPWLYRLTPLPAGLTAGREPVAVEIAGRQVAANICYETALPEAVRSLVVTLARAGRRPDVIVNLTNDGWFWGSSELDMHLTAAIFRAVEVRTPLVIAANTGFSASIDGSGRLLARGPRRATAALRVAVQPDGRSSPWLAAGSLPLWVCVAVAAALAVTGPSPCTGGGRSPTI